MHIFSILKLLIEPLDIKTGGGGASRYLRFVVLHEREEFLVCQVAHAGPARGVEPAPQPPECDARPLRQSGTPVVQLLEADRDHRTLQDNNTLLKLSTRDFTAHKLCDVSDSVDHRIDVDPCNVTCKAASCPGG